MKNKKPEMVVCSYCWGEGHIEKGEPPIDVTCTSCNGTGKVSPPEPVKPDEGLLKEITALLETAKFDCGGSDDYAPCNPSILDADNLAKQILLKCHQSESAIRADQNKKIGEVLKRDGLDKVQTKNALKFWIKEYIAKLQKGESPEVKS